MTDVVRACRMRRSDFSAVTPTSLFQRGAGRPIGGRFRSGAQYPTARRVSPRVPWGFAYSYPVALSGELGDLPHTHWLRGSHPGQRPVLAAARLERHAGNRWGLRSRWSSGRAGLGEGNTTVSGASCCQHCCQNRKQPAPNQRNWPNSSTKTWCRGADSNRRHIDFQSIALPTEEYRFPPGLFHSNTHPGKSRRVV